MPINRQRWGRRAALRAVLSGAGALLLPRAASARQTTLIDPYEGSIPLVFPLAEGTYAGPLGDNWHAPREGAAYPWNHRLVGPRRLHDGVDVTRCQTLRCHWRTRRYRVPWRPSATVPRTG